VTFSVIGNTSGDGNTSDGSSDTGTVYTDPATNSLTDSDSDDSDWEPHVAIPSVMMDPHTPQISQDNVITLGHSPSLEPGLDPFEYDPYVNMSIITSSLPNEEPHPLLSDHTPLGAPPDVVPPPPPLVAGTRRQHWPVVQVPPIAPPPPPVGGGQGRQWPVVQATPTATPGPYIRLSTIQENSK